jgi:hypothetical protein
MEGMTGPGGVPAWRDEELGWEELPNQVEHFGGFTPLGEQLSVRLDKPATLRFGSGLACTRTHASGGQPRTLP